MRLNKHNLKTFPIIGLTQGSRSTRRSYQATASTDNHAAGGNAAEHLFKLLESKSRRQRESSYQGFVSQKKLAFTRNHSKNKRFH